MECCYKISLYKYSQLPSLTNIKSLELHLNPWRCDCHLKQFRFEKLLSLFCCFFHPHHYYCHLHHHHSWKQSNMRRNWSVGKVKRRYEAYAQLELLLLLHTFGDFSSPNWGTVKLKWMLPENHTQRNIVTNTTPKYKY